MSQLIQLRQRIRAIETIKKITHAMRLISMSSHTRMRTREEPFTFYLRTLQQLTQLVKEMPHCPSPLSVAPLKSDLHLIILVGSQRGLCGNFNTLLFHFFEQHTKLENYIVIPVGRKAVNYCLRKNYKHALSFPYLIVSNTGSLASDIVEYIQSHQKHFASVSVISNQLKTFFIQKPQRTFLMPQEETFHAAENKASAHEYIWEQSPEELIAFLATEQLHAQLQYLLFQSLLAEQAARFISMDSATRNAQNILDATKLSYNKLRQAKITKELTELTGTLT